MERDAQNSHDMPDLVKRIVEIIKEYEKINSVELSDSNKKLIEYGYVKAKFDAVLKNHNKTQISTNIDMHTDVTGALLDDIKKSLDILYKNHS